MSHAPFSPLTRFLANTLRSTRHASFSWYPHIHELRGSPAYRAQKPIGIQGRTADGLNLGNALMGINILMSGASPSISHDFRLFKIGRAVPSWVDVAWLHMMRNSFPCRRGPGTGLSPISSGKKVLHPGIFEHQLAATSPCHGANPISP